MVKWCWLAMAAAWTVVSGEVREAKPRKVGGCYSATPCAPDWVPYLWDEIYPVCRYNHQPVVPDCRKAGGLLYEQWWNNPLLPVYPRNDVGLCREPFTRRFGIALTVAAWGLFGIYESYMYYWSRTVIAPIRVDLLLLTPILYAVTIFGLVQATMRCPALSRSNRS